MVTETVKCANKNAKELKHTHIFMYLTSHHFLKYIVAMRNGISTMISKIMSCGYNAENHLTPMSFPIGGERKLDR